MQPWLRCLLVLGLMMKCQDAPSPAPLLTTASTVQPLAVLNAVGRTLYFSGYTWTVKAASDGPVGPGPNYFADSADQVWVDAQGRLHLRIAYKYGRWWAAEVISTRSFGYGTYHFDVDTTLDDLDPNIVLGLFTWSDHPALHHREIDIEIARWGQANNDNGQCVVQPYNRPENVVRFALPRGLPMSQYSFTWDAQRIVCQVRQGSPLASGSTLPLIYEHTFTAGIPTPGGENARINFWLLGGEAPQHGQDSEVIIHRFEFLPL